MPEQQVVVNPLPDGGVQVVVGDALTWVLDPEQAENLAIRLLMYRQQSTVVPSRRSDRLKRCPTCWLFFAPSRSSQTYCRDACRAAAQYGLEQSLFERIRESNPSQAVYVVCRLRNGNWTAWTLNPGDEPEPLQLSDWIDLYPGDAPRSDFMVTDDSTGAPRLAHEVFFLAFSRAHMDIGDYWSMPYNQQICRAFAEERMWPMYTGHTVAWTETFMRDWYTDRKTRLEAPAPQTHNP